MNILNKFKSMKLYMQIFIVSFFTIFVFFIIILFTYTQTTKNFKVKNEQYTNEIILRLKQTIYTNYNALSKITKLISFDKEVQNFLMEENEPIKFEYFQSAFSNLVNLKTLNDQILDIVIVNNNGEKYNITDGKSFDIPLNITNKKINVSPILHYEKQNNIPYIIMGKNIYCTNSYIKMNECIGSVYLILGDSAFISTDQTSYQNLNSNIYLFDTNSELFWSNNNTYDKNEVKNLTTQLKLLQQGKLKDTNNENVKIELLKDIPMYTVSVLHNEDFVNGIQRVQMASYFIFLIAILFISIIWIVLIKNIVNPLKKLVYFITTIKSKRLYGLKIRMNLSGYQEISIVNTEFNKMLESIDKLTRQLVDTASNLYEVELDKREIELAHLRSQINPHFLYNTLETIKGIALQQGIPEITTITKSLATIFKYSIKGENIVTLKDELKIGKSYLEIQLFRFSERFDVTYDIKRECISCFVPKMILQPIIENAIVHGIENHDGFCNLKISATLSDKLIITIEDDGNGIDKIKLEEITQSLNNSNKLSCTNGIGIHNINNRIRLIYGNNYGVKISSVIHKGTSVTITLPINRR